MTVRNRKKNVAGATKPRCLPTGVNGSSAANATTASEKAISHGVGRLLKGFLRVRMMKNHGRIYLQYYNPSYRDSLSVWPHFEAAVRGDIVIRPLGEGSQQES